MLPRSRLNAELPEGQPLIDAANDAIDSIEDGATAKRGGEGTEEEVPETYQHHQNYPNPFNPVTTIAYSLPVSQHVIVTLFDALGCKVATLVNGWKTTGRHEVVFDAGTLPSGVYLYRLQAGPYIETKKLLLAK